MKKGKPASKAAGSGWISWVDAKGRFLFFHSASVGIPKTFAFFFFFLSPAWVLVLSLNLVQVQLRRWYFTRS
ncbi:hypothetical protein EDM52_11130 [Brevibacillus invocatus]|uniref:Transmembrane protein n=1 Tax=Brevibacillus invocatus TaxID=173959 RepID=A0A3M8CFC9_9BACL|nr:hypothetical protein EDM52_11130 [Brevibacillus invocatus]